MTRVMSPHASRCRSTAGRLTPAKRVTVAVLGALVVAALAAGADAQCTTSTSTCSVANLPSITETVPKLSSLDVSTASLALNASTVGGSHFLAGYVDGAALAVTAYANTAWSVTFAAGASSFGYSGSYANPSKAVGDLTWARSASCPTAVAYAALTTTGAAVYASGTGSATPQTGVSQTLCFRTMLGWTTTVPGTYTVQMTFTITAP